MCLSRAELARQDSARQLAVGALLGGGAGGGSGSLPQGVGGGGGQEGGGSGGCGAAADPGKCEKVRTLLRAPSLAGRRRRGSV